MNQGPKIKTRLATIALLSASALGPKVSLASSCEALLNIIGTPKKTSAATKGSITNRQNTNVTRRVNIEDLFTFETNADAMGFRPDKKILRATPEELNEIIKLTKGNSKDIVGIASEINYYLQSLPFNSVGEAFDLVRLRNEFGVDPQAARSTFEDVVDIVFRPQSKHVQPFPPNTDYGVAHSTVVNVAAMHLAQDTLNLRQTRILMKYIENSFPSARRLHQTQLLQVFLATRVENPEASFTQYAKVLQRFQDELVIERNVVGFAGVEQIRPSLEDALMLKILADRANMSVADMVTVAETIVKSHRPTSFIEVGNIIAEGLQKLDTEQAAPQVYLN
jgi:hypothetical protein